MAGVAAAVASVLISQTINQAVSTTFAKGIELFQINEAKKKLLILLTNDTDEDWDQAEAYLKDGTSNYVPPKTIKKRNGDTFIVRRSRLPLIAGGGAIRGILTYKINGKGDVLVIFFEVPIVLGPNHWNIKICRRDEIESFGVGRQKLEALYSEMSRNDNSNKRDSIKAADNSYYYDDELHPDYKVKSIMTTTAKCKIRIDVSYGGKAEEKSEVKDQDKPEVKVEDNANSDDGDKNSGNEYFSCTNKNS